MCKKIFSWCNAYNHGNQKVLDCLGMFTWLCVSPMHFFFHFENLQYNYHAQTRVWYLGSRPPQFQPLPPQKKKKNPLILDPPPPHPPFPYLGKFSGSRHHYTTSFIKVRAEIYPCKSPGERISFWHFNNKLTWFLVGFTITGYIPNTGSCTTEAITHLIPGIWSDRHKKTICRLEENTRWYLKYSDSYII